jgi:hypothetical protein
MLYICKLSNKLNLNQAIPVSHNLYTFAVVPCLLYDNNGGLAEKYKFQSRECNNFIIVRRYPLLPVI